MCRGSVSWQCKCMQTACCVRVVCTVRAHTSRPLHSWILFSRFHIIHLVYVSLSLIILRIGFCLHCHLRRRRRRHHHHHHHTTTSVIIIISSLIHLAARCLFELLRNRIQKRQRRQFCSSLSFLLFYSFRRCAKSCWTHKLFEKCVYHRRWRRKICPQITFTHCSGRFGCWEFCQIF